MRISLPVFGVLLLLPLSGWAQQLDARCTKGTETGCIDWERGVAIALGSGAPARNARNAAQKNATAQRAAKLDAARNVLEMIKGISLSSSTTMKDMMVENDTVESSIQGRLFSLRQVGRAKYFSDGSIQIKVEVSLRRVLPPALVAGESSDTPRQLPPPSSPPPGGGPINPAAAYTGLVIDARGTGVLPALSPKVFDPDGNEVYGSAYVSRQWALSQGVLGYTKTIEAATKSDRMKMGGRSSPAIVKALKAIGVNKADLVLSKTDADIIRAIAQNQAFLSEGRVMVVLD